MQSWNEYYPRPQLRRNSWMNLNGTWEFQESGNSQLPERYDETILIPFPPQSLLSGVHRDIPEEHFLFYRRNFARPEILDGQRVILHIGAVDQVATVWVNGVKVGEHIGGYEHISLDITHTLRMDEAVNGRSIDKNEIVIRAVDSLSRHILPYGKQTNKRGGMWYTPVSGIWQSVWLEIVPETYIEDLTIQTGSDWVEISVAMAGNPPAAGLPSLFARIVYYVGIIGLSSRIQYHIGVSAPDSGHDPGRAYGTGTRAHAPPCRISNLFTGLSRCFPDHDPEPILLSDAKLGMGGSHWPCPH